MQQEIQYQFCCHTHMKWPIICRRLWCKLNCSNNWPNRWHSRPIPICAVHRSTSRFHSNRIHLLGFADRALRWWSHCLLEFVPNHIDWCIFEWNTWKESNLRIHIRSVDIKHSCCTIDRRSEFARKMDRRVYQFGQSKMKHVHKLQSEYLSHLNHLYWKVRC